MHADFRLQQPVRVLAVDFEGYGLDARAFALQTVRHHGLKSLALGPSQIHAQQHLGPVLAFRAAGAGVNGNDSAARVVLARQQHGRLQALQRLRLCLEIALDVAVDVFAFTGEFKEGVEIVGHGADASSFAIASSRRLRSCITFWLFSGWFQKSGEEIWSSVLASFAFCAGASKIPPHGQCLFAEGLSIRGPILPMSWGFNRILTNTRLYRRSARGSCPS